MFEVITHGVTFSCVVEKRQDCLSITFCLVLCNMPSLCAEFHESLVVCDAVQASLPSGGLLTPRGLQLLGLSGLGSSGGLERLHYL